jgi:hypothetical protein
MSPPKSNNTAKAATHLGARKVHDGVVGPQVDGAGDTLVKRWPAGARLVFGIRQEERVAAAATLVDAFAFLLW